MQVLGNEAGFTPKSVEREDPDSDEPPLHKQEQLHQPEDSCVDKPLDMNAARKAENAEDGLAAEDPSPRHGIFIWED